LIHAPQQLKGILLVFICKKFVKVCVRLSVFMGLFIVILIISTLFDTSLFFCATFDVILFFWTSFDSILTFCPPFDVILVFWTSFSLSRLCLLAPPHGDSRAVFGIACRYQLKPPSHKWCSWGVMQKQRVAFFLCSCFALEWHIFAFCSH